MEDPDDSLTFDSNDGISGPVLTIDRRTDMEATNRLINSLDHGSNFENTSNCPLDQRYLVNMQAGQFSNQPAFASNILDMEDFHRPGEGFNLQDEELMKEAENFHGNQLATGNDVVAAPNNSYKRSGPEGSPAFQQQSSGYLPVDNESVVFRPVKTLDFSALDETGATEEILPQGMNRSVSTPNSKNRSVSFIQEREICGSLGDDERSHDASPSDGFFELKSSPVHSTDGEEELNSRVIFSPLKNLENLHEDGGLETGRLSGLETGRLSGLETGRLSVSSQSPTSPQRNVAVSAMSPSQGVNYIPFSSYTANATPGNMVVGSIRTSPLHNTGSAGFLPGNFSPQHQSNHTETETGRCTPPQSPAHSLSPKTLHNQQLSRNSPGNYASETSPSRLRSNNMDRKEVLVSIPQMYHDSYREVAGNTEVYDRQNMTYPQNVSKDSGITEQTGTHSGVRYSQMSDSDRDEFMSSDRAGQEQSLPTMASSAWEIPVSEESRKQQPKNFHREQKLKNKQSVDKRPFVSTVRNAPKNVNIGHQKLSKNEQVKGDNHIATQIPRNKAFGAETKQTNGNNRIVRGEDQGPQRFVQKSNYSDVDRRKGSYPTKQNYTNQGNKERTSVTEGVTRQSVPMHTQNRHILRNQGYTGQSEKVLTQREETQGEASDSRPDGTSPKHPGLNVVTQVQQYGSLVMEEHPHHTSGEFEKTRPDRSLDVQGMEDVRSQLQNMLKMSFESDMGPYNNPGDQIMDFPLQEHPHFHIPIDNQAIRNSDDVSDLMENFPSFTSRMWTESANISRSDSSLHAENQRLREAIEKERYRRKHCEQHIQRLNVKLLETQQQLAVSVSTDKRKDIMIEQLDKQLAKVVEGWKKRDSEKEEHILELKKAKNLAEEKFLKHKEMIEHFEKDMADTVESLRKEKDSSAVMIDKLQTEIDEKERQRAHTVEMLDAEKERTTLMSKEWESVRENREHLEKKIQQLQERLHNEQDEWFKREQELIQKIDEVSEGSQKILQQEREKTEEQGKLLKEIEEKYSSSQTENKRMEMDLDAATREKESLKVEMGIMEAKFESNLRMLEADLHSQMEKEIATQIADVHKRMEQTEDELRENHRQQISEINQRNKRDLEKQLAKFHEELKTRDMENRKHIQEYEERLQASRKEISTLKSAKQKLESQRYEILTKLQYMMQSQWNEAVSLLVSTPQRQKSQPFTSQQNYVQETKGGVHFKIPNQSENQMSSPGKDSVHYDSNSVQQSDVNREVTVGQERVTEQQSELNINDLNASLYMQQFLQSLTHPIMFPTAQPPDRSTDDNIMINSSENPHLNHQNIIHRPPEERLLNMDDMQVVHTQIPPGSSAQNVENYHAHVPVSCELTNQHVQNWSHVQNDMTHLSNNQGQRSVTSKQNVESWLHHSVGHGHVMNTSGQSIDGWFPHQSIPQAAVAIRPPQQHASFDYEASTNQKPAYSQNNQDQVPQRVVYSPPTKQSRSQTSEEQNRQAEGSDDSVGEISAVLDETLKLNAEYNQMEAKFDQHEFRQSELQHYIQMLLQKPPGGAVEDSGQDGHVDESASMFSHDQTEDLDLNDTAQAAQIQKELYRIQQLREKQALAAKKIDNDKGPQASGNESHNDTVRGQVLPPGVLHPEQLADISRLLGQYREHWDTSQHKQNLDMSRDGEQIVELVNILKNMQERYPQSPKVTADPQSPRGKKAPMSRLSPGSPRNKELAKVKRNLKGQLSMVSDGSNQKETIGDKSQSKSQGQGQPKKLDRKVAAAGVMKGQSKSKSAWK